LLYLLTFTSTYLLFEKTFKIFTQERLRFASQLIIESSIDANNAVDIVIKRTFLFVSSKYKDAKTLLEKLKLLIDIITTPIVLLFIFLIRFSIFHPDLLSIAIMITGSALDSLFIKSGDITIPILTLMWLYSIYKYRLTDKLFFIMAFSFLVSSSIFYYSDWLSASEKFGAWSWIFLTMAVIINTIKLRRQAN